MKTLIRPELDAVGMPARMRALPLDDRGYPVPWFVAWVDGKPEFRAMDARKFRDAVKHGRCWVCGEKLGKWKTFVIGPMCAVNRTTAEPPSHTDCAIWSAKNCPFLTRPHMVRREDEFSRDPDHAPAGHMITRNPGVALVWTTRGYFIQRDSHGQPLIEVGDPDDVLWFCEGRPATRAEVQHSIETGLPLLRAAADTEVHTARREAAHKEINRRLASVATLYPAV